MIAAIQAHSQLFNVACFSRATLKKLGGPGDEATSHLSKNKHYTIASHIAAVHVGIQ